METNFDKPLEQDVAEITEVATPTISSANSAITDFGHNSFVKNGIMYVRGFFHAGALADQAPLLTISGYKAKKRSEGIMTTKLDDVTQSVYIAENSSLIQINTYHANTSSNWSFIMIDILVEKI